jgi:hypothetical protein
MSDVTRSDFRPAVGLRGLGRACDLVAVLPRADAADGELTTADRNKRAPHHSQEQESAMSHPDVASAKLRDELHNAPVEPLLPIEKKLIALSVAIGLALLAVLAAVNHFIPAGP